MSTLMTPAFTGTINDKPLRFFKAPLPGPHLLWHATDDLVACLDLPRGLRRHYQQKLKGSEYAKDIRTVATADGIVTIAPHWVAQGFISAIIETGFAKPAIEVAYGREAVKAWKAMTGDLPPGASLNMMLEAFNNTNASAGGPAPGGAA